MEIVPLILCGGEGSRLWPLTNEATPKHMLRLPNGRSLFEDTLERAEALANLSNNAPLIVTATNQKFKDAIIKQSTKLVSSLSTLKYLVEPLARDTAPAITLAALSLAAEGRKNAVLVVMPADHKIDGNQTFLETMLSSIKQANLGKLVSIGVRPNFASTAFGYLEVQNGIVSKFTEKPCTKIANEFFTSKSHFWNSGIFCCKVELLIELLQKHCSLLLEQCQKTFQNARNNVFENRSMIEFDLTDFAKIEDKSIDYQLLNRLTDTVCVEAKFRWSDVGSWDSYCDLFNKDEQGNSNSWSGFSEDSRNCTAFTSRKPIAMIGLKDVVVVNTDEAILVANKHHSQEIKYLARKCWNNLPFHSMLINRLLVTQQR